MDINNNFNSEKNLLNANNPDYYNNYNINNTVSNNFNNLNIPNYPTNNLGFNPSFENNNFNNNNNNIGNTTYNNMFNQLPNYNNNYNNSINDRFNNSMPNILVNSNLQNNNINSLDNRNFNPMLGMPNYNMYGTIAQMNNNNQNLINNLRQFNNQNQFNANFPNNFNNPNTFNNYNNFNFNVANDMNRSMPNFPNFNNQNKLFSLEDDIKFYKEQIKKEKEEELKAKLLEIEEEKKNTVIAKDELEKKTELQKRIIASKTDIEVYVPRSEYMSKSERYFFEELLLQPLRVGGCLGTNNIYIDKENLFKYFKEKNIEDQALIIKNKVFENALKKKNVKNIDSTNNENNNNKINNADEDDSIDNNYINNDIDQYSKYKEASRLKTNDYFCDISRDGIYLDIVKKQIFSYNLQKIEQRLLNEKKYDWFKFNGDIRLDTDIFSEIISKPVDISLSYTLNTQTIELPAYLTNRITSKIKKSYKMKIFISSILLEDHPFMSEEYKLNFKLKRLYNEFYEQLNLQKVKYYRNSIEKIKEQLDYYENELLNKKENESILNEIKCLNLLLSESNKLLEKEKCFLNDLSKDLYNSWLELKRLRINQGFSSTTNKLSVLKFNNLDATDINKVEYIKEMFNYAFILNYSNYSSDEVLIDLEKNLNRFSKQELDTRNKLRSLKAFVSIYVNNVLVAKTDEKFLSWPNCEFNYSELLNINVYTRPAKIELELNINKGFSKSKNKAARFEIEAPGIFTSNTSTASSLVEKIRFKNWDSTNPNIKKTYKSLNNKNNPLKINMEENKEKLKKYNLGKNINSIKSKFNKNEFKSLDEENQSLTNSSVDNVESIQEVHKNENNNAYLKFDICSGVATVKCEWEDSSSFDMPPSEIDSKLYVLQQQFEFHDMIKNINRYDYPFDINDPRNIFIFDKIKREKTEIMLKYFLKEIELPYTDIESVRHLLLIGRNKKLSFKNIKVPLIEKDILNNYNYYNKYIEEIKKDLDLNKIKSGSSNDINKNIEINNNIQKELDKLEQMYVGRQIGEEDFKDIVLKKIRLMKKDICTKPQKSYHDVVKEFVAYDTPLALCKNIFQNIFLPSRKLKPRRKRRKIDINKNPTEITINIHLMKGYNIPVRINSLPEKGKQDLKTRVIDTFFKSGAKDSDILLNRLLQRENIINNMNNVKTNNSSLNNYNQLNTMNVNYNANNSFNNSYNMNNYNINNNNMDFYNPPKQNPMFNNYNNSNYNNSTNVVNNSQTGIINEQGKQVADFLQILSTIKKNIESFVEVKCVYYNQEYEVRSDTVEGVHPDYNHKISFTIKPENGEYFTKQEIHNCTGGVHFTLFDEVKSEQIIEEKSNELFIYKYEKKYLGDLLIPFSTIFQNAVLLETMSKVNIPINISGYYSDSSSVNSIIEKLSELTKKGELDADTLYNEDIIRIINPNISTYLSLYMSVEPLLSLFKDEEPDFVRGFEDPKFLTNSTSLLKEYRSKSMYSNRHLKIFAENFDGFSVFISRYLHPQEPPSVIYDKINNSDDSLAIEKAARYVSLIPFIEDCQAFEEMPDCWCTDYEFINLGFGDYEEHAILLCNYFNYIDINQGKDIRSYLVLGKGHPEGNTNYVIRCNIKNNDYELWNAKSGECNYFNKQVSEVKCCGFSFGNNYKSISINDSLCQLKDVGCIVSNENLYINIQKSGNPASIDFNISNKKNWKPFLDEAALNKYFISGIQSIQKPIDNKEGNIDDAYAIKEEIHKYIKKQ